MTIIDFLKDFILVMVYDSFMTLMIVLLILAIFRIRDSGIRIMFLFLPLVKPFLIVLEDFKLNVNFFNSRGGVLGFRFPSPNTIFQRIDSANDSFLFYSNIDTIILIVIFLCILAILLIRWSYLFLFYKRLAYEEKVTEADIPDIYMMLKYSADRLHIKTPQINLTYRNYFSPFVVGIKKPIIVISPVLLDILTNEEKEILLNHELAHIQRHDNLISWLSLIFKDLLFFNPFAYIAYHLIKFEQEKGCDNLILKFSGKSPKIIAASVLSIILKIKTINKKSDKKFLFIQSSGFLSFQKINLRFLKLKINNILYSNPDKNFIKKPLKIFCILIFILLLAIQFVIVVKISESSFIFLR
jgi:beta-lactamase regulating signal transducer with metallopeptidase domain